MARRYYNLCFRGSCVRRQRHLLSILLFSSVSPVRVGCLIAFVLTMLSATASVAKSPKEFTYYELALESFIQEEYESAVIHLKNALQTAPSHLPSRLLLGETYLQLRKPGAASIQFKFALDGGADRSSALPRLAMAYLIGLQFERVLDEIKPGGGRIELDAQIQVLRGRAYLELGRVAEAENAFNRATELQPMLVDALLGKADAELRRGQTEPAAVIVEQALAIDENNASAWHFSGDMQRNVGRFDQALVSYDRALKLEPKRVDARMSRAATLVALGQIETALKEVVVVQGQSPGHPYAAYLKARILKRLGRSAEAKVALNGAGAALENLDSELLKKHPPSLFLAGALLLEQGYYEQAYTYLLQLHQIRPDHLQGLLLLARTTMLRGYLRNAAALVEPLRKSGSQNLEVLSLLGEIYLRLGEFEQAERFYASALEIATDSPALHRRLADIYMASTRADAAVGELIQSFLLDPNDLGTVLLLVGMLYKDGDYDRAIRLARWLHNRIPKNPTVFNLIGASLLQKGEFAAARNRNAPLDDFPVVAHRLFGQRIFRHFRYPDVAKRRAI